MIGVDPGVKTGVAIWDSEEKKFHTLVTCDILDAVDLIRKAHVEWTGHVFVRIEDPNQRKWYGKNSNSKMQGAGSVKRDFKVIKDFLEKNKIPFHAYHPKDVRTKLNADQFRKITGVTIRTSQHVRDAAMAVYGF